MGWHCGQKCDGRCGERDLDQNFEVQGRSHFNGRAALDLFHRCLRSHVRSGLGLLLPVPSLLVILPFDDVEKFFDCTFFRPILFGCVAGYFFLMGVLTIYTTLWEKGIFVVALQKDPAGLDPDSVWEASSNLKK